MSTYHLQSVFRPQSVAVIGGSPRERSAGRAVMRNLRGTGFPGKVAWINPRHAEIDGIRTVKRLKDLDWVPDLVVITAPAAIVPQVVRTAAERGVQAAIILTAHLGEGPGSLSAQVEAVARKHGLRILGPHCLGVIAPHARLNASIAAHFPQAGDLALISESSAIAAALVEWGVARSVGFSAVVSLGDTMDVDFGDLLDYFATDYRTRAILLYVEQIKDARKFMSAARAAARAKPVVVVKSGRAERVQPGSRDTHVQALARADDVYGAAFNRAGLLRVGALDELFTAAESLGRLGTFPGRRLAILSNGGGVGRLAVDQLIALRGTLATLSDSTVQKLDAVLPQGWSRSNPVDIVVDADGERYAAAIEALLADNENDAVMVVNVPTAFTSSADAAQALTRTLGLRPRHHRDKPVFAVWLGNDDQATATLNAARVPTYPTEAEAVRGFQHLVRYREAQNALMETPPSLPQDFNVDAASARTLVDAALANGQQWLDPLATHELLKAYGIPSAPVMHARDAHEAMDLAQPLLERGASVALKILSPDIPHKSEVDGVRLNLSTLPAVQSAANAILSRARQLRPDARIDGLLVQPTIVRPKARELIVGIADDATFGPVIVVGRGGTAVEVINDKALALPPLDLRLAHELIGQTRASRILKAYGDVPPPTSAHWRWRWSSWRSWPPTFPKYARWTSTRCWSTAGHPRPRRARGGGAVAHPAQGPRPSALLGVPVPEGVGAHHRTVRWRPRVRAPGAAGRRCAVSRVLRPRQRRRPAPALLPVGEALQPRVHRAPDPARLRALDCAGGDRAAQWRNARRGAPARRCRLPPWRVRHPDPLGPEGPWHRLAADGDHDRVRQVAGAGRGRRPGAAREQHHAGDVPEPGLQDPAGPG